MVRPPYQLAVRLCGIAAEMWPQIDAAYYQVELLTLRPHRILNLVYAWCLERIDPEGLDSWLDEMRDLLPWQSADSEAGAMLESESFFAMQGTGGE